MRGAAQDIKQKNRNHIVNFIFERGRTTKQQIAEGLSISLPTVLTNIKDLLSEGLIRETGLMESTGGRKAIAIAPCAQARVSVGVDVKRTGVTLVLADLCGGVLREEEVPLPFAWSEEYFAGLGRTIEGFLASSGRDPERVLGVGFSIPGTVSADGNTIVYSVMLSLYNRPSAAFRGATKYPCCFMHDSDASGCAENMVRGSRETFVYLMLSELVGGSVFVDGLLYPGRFCRAGEFGHMRLVKDGKKCYCGKVGCAHPYLAVSALTGEGREAELKDFFQRLGRGELRASGVWDEYMNNLSAMAATLNMAFDCPVVLGGKIGGYLDGHIAEIRRRSNLLNLFTDGDYVSPCLVRSAAAALGAAMRPVRDFFAEI